ncbi:MAG TPA: HsdR family type I site-specific deoxyribonuclease [bacterium]|nr:HsdR family type I site-specific deoxyribonuclease [bacterium]HPQ71988.1 HsdR family type I site-specific deoxyribonuclease [bacterium]
MAQIGSEKKTVQGPLVRYARQAGWTYVPPTAAVAMRKGEGGLLFGRVLEEKLIELNSGWLTADKAVEAIGRIEAVPNTIEGNAEILAWLRGEQSRYDEKEKRERNVTVIDFNDPDRNVFQVTDEWQYTNGLETNRADVMFLINGIPVAVVETKSATRAKGIEEGLVQIREYHRETPEMLTAPQVFNLTHLIDFYYGATWNLDRKNLFNWRDEEPGDYEKKVKAFFDRRRFLTMLKEWILFFYKEDELQKTVLRQHQTRAVDRILARCADASRTTGLIWHTQGSGKTFTLLTAARLILQDNETFGKATVVLIIDRNELEGQLSEWVERILGEETAHGISIAYATSKEKLRELLAADFRGLIVSMIHKFDGIPPDLNPRENIFVLIDEAHRSTGGDLGNYLLGALPKATLIGFTGTPIDKTAYGQGTFKVFGKEDERGYLDKYSIAESIADGTTVPLKYTLAPSEIRVPREQLEREFMALAQAEGVSDIDELNKILDRSTRLKTFLKADDRVEKVAAFVAEHFTNNVEPLGYKAFLVAVDREACALYKEALDKVLPPEYSLPIYTPAQHDSERYPLVYRHQVTPEAEKKARKLFPKPHTLPKIFIVTDKLLTGFDAPILYCMYLDKPMRDHVLLQAIARVNRPYERDPERRKPCGLVVDFVGIFEKLEQALAFDSEVVSGVIEDLDLLFEKFKELMDGPAREYTRLCRGPIDDKAIERAIEVFSDREEREAFYKFYRRIEMLYEILSPSPGLRIFIDDFGRLSVLYRIVRNAFRKGTILYNDVADKTSRLIRERAEIYGPKETLPVVEIDEKTLDAIKKSNGSEKAKIINLVNGIREKVLEDGESNPYLKPIGDRAEAIMDAYDRRQDTTETALRKIEELIREIVEAQKLQEKMGCDETTFSFFWTLKEEDIDRPERAAVVLGAIFDRFPHHRDNAAELRQLKAELYRVLLPLVGKERMISIAEKLLRAWGK